MTLATLPLVQPDGRRDWDRSLAAFDAARCYDRVRVRFWGREVVLVNRTEDIHAVLVERAEDFRKGPVLSVNAKPLLGNGLLTGDNARNRRQRRLISPAFAHKRVLEYAPVVVRWTERQQALWPDGAVVDAPQEMLAITLGIIGELLLSADLLTSARGVGNALATLMNFAVDEMRAPWRAVMALPRALRALLFLNRTVYRHIDARREQGDAEADLLARLLFARDEEGQGMGERLVRDETMTLFLAGLETVAVALFWSLYLLDRHPDIRERLEAEVDAALAGRPPTVDDLPRLPYALQVFKESMRLYPPAYIVARQALRPVEVGDMALPAGTVVFASPYVRHRDPAHFPDPDKFDPDRWADPDAEKRLPRYAFLPFGSGPRVCVGGHFALLEAHLILAALVQRVRFTRVPGHEEVRPEPLFTLRPAGRVPMRVIRRGASSAG